MHTVLGMRNPTNVHTTGGRRQQEEQCEERGVHFNEVSCTTFNVAWNHKTRTAEDMSPRNVVETMNAPETANDMILVQGMGNATGLILETETDAGQDQGDGTTTGPNLAGESSGTGLVQENAKTAHAGVTLARMHSGQRLNVAGIERLLYVVEDPIRIFRIA